MDNCYDCCLLITLARVNAVVDDRLTMEWHSVSELNFDFTHQVVAIFPTSHGDTWRDAMLTLDDIVVSSPLSTLFTMYHMW